MKIGSVIKIYDNDLLKPKVKWFIIVGDVSGTLATIFINTDPKPEELTPELQGQQLSLSKDSCTFLDHDSFADCSEIIIRPKGKINEILQREPKRELGTVPKDVMEEITRLIRVSDSIDNYTKKQFGFL